MGVMLRPPDAPCLLFHSPVASQSVERPSDARCWLHESAGAMRGAFLPRPNAARDSSPLGTEGRILHARCGR